mgnify:CR=1 FL=1
MSKFVLTAQLQLQAPNNTRQVVQQIQNQLKGVNVNVAVQGTAQANKQVQKLSGNLNAASKNAGKLGKNFAASVRRFSAMAIANRAVSLFTNTLSAAISESIKFERELVKIVQVTGKSTEQLQFLTDTVRNLATSLGVGSTSLLGVSRTLSQAGMSAKETQIALKTLARTELAPTFENITQTAEGAVAIFNQFRAGAAALEEQLGAVNAVAGKFAVEAGDIIAAVRRTGGVFKAAGGDLNELIALFTSVRSTTRESAESISTGLRTIFTRIQRPKTIEFMKQFGVELTDLEGKFVGPFEAVKRLSGALAGLEQGDVTFIKIAEELGGFRQIGKVIPLIQEFAVAQQALKVAQKGQDSLAKDAASAQAALAIRIAKVKEEFLELIDNVTKTPTFQLMASAALGLASALIKVADSLKVILPIITAIAAVKFTKGISGFLGGVAGAFSGKARGFNKGGFVPGSGNSDTVPAMLTPGEFVIRKKSAQAMGGEALGAINKYAKGGKILTRRQPVGMLVNSIGEGDPKDTEGSVTLKSIKSGTPAINKLKTKAASIGKPYKFKVKVAKSQFNKQDKFKTDAIDPVTASIEDAAGMLGIAPKGGLDKINTALGQMFEDFVNKQAGLDSPGSANFDLVDKEAALNGLTKEKIKKFTDIKLRDTDENANTLAKKAVNEGLFNAHAKREFNKIKNQRSKRVKKAAGGSITGAGSDTVPALLTPGEFVVNKESAKSIGYSNLSHMNKYADGGIVSQFKRSGVQGLSNGGLPMVPLGALQGQAYTHQQGQSRMAMSSQTAPSPVGKASKKTAEGLNALTGGLVGAQMALSMLTPAIDENSSGTMKATAFVMNSMNSLVGTITLVQMALAIFGKELTMDSVKKFFKNFDMGDVKDMLSGKGGKIKSAITKGATSKIQGAGKGLRNIGRNMSQGAKAMGGARGKAANLAGKGIRNVGRLFTKLGPSLGKLIGTVSGLVGPMTLAAGTVSMFNGFLDSYTDYAAKASKAIEEGNVASAEKAAAEDHGAKAVNNVVTGMTALAAVVPVIGPLLATVGGVAIKVASELPYVGKFVKEFASGINVMFGGKTMSSVVAMAGAAAAVAKAHKNLESGIKKAAQAMEDFKAGRISVTQMVQKTVSQTKNIDESREKTKEAIKENNKNKSGMGDGFMRGTARVLTLGIAGYMGLESGAQRNKGIDEENKKASLAQMDLDAKQGDMRRGAAMSAARSSFASGKSIKETEADLEAQGLGPGAQREQSKEYLKLARDLEDSGDKEGGKQAREAAAAAEQRALDLERGLKNLKEEVERNIKAFAAMNLGLNSSVGSANSMSLAMSQFMQAQESGTSTLMNSFNTLESSATSAAVGLSSGAFKSSMNEVTGVMKEFGASGDQIDKFRGNMTAVFQAQKNSEKGLKKFQERLKSDQEGGLGGMNPQEKLNSLVDTILPAGMDEDVKKRFKEQLAGMDIDYDQIAKGDFSQIEGAFQGVADAQLQQVKAIMEAENQYRQAVLDITKKRYAAEDALIGATKKTADLRAESEKIIADAGGPAFTPDRQREILMEKTNAGAGAAGVDPLTGMSAADIKKQQQDLQTRTKQVEGAKQRNIIGSSAKIVKGDADPAARGAMTDEERMATDKSSADVAKQNMELLNTTRSLIDIKKAEIQIIQAKNKLESDSFNALMSGDIDSFFQAQSTSGAMGAIASGNTGDFSADQLQSAYEELKRQADAGVTEFNGQQLQGPGGLLEKAATSTLTARGMDPGAAAAMAQRNVLGSPEEQAANAEIRELAALLPGFGETEQLAASMQIQAAELQLMAAGKIKEKKLEEAENSKTLAAGGVVYASRGKLINFQPRGTDTVPAMLTPGEFVVNRSAVRSGNNLSVLKAMNSGARGAATATMSKGGTVYAQGGGQIAGAGGAGMDSSTMTNFVTALENFNKTIMESINALQNTQFTVKLEPTTVNINLTGGSFLQSLTSNLKDQLLQTIGEKFRSLRVNSDGKVVESQSEV